MRIADTTRYLLLHCRMHVLQPCLCTCKFSGCFSCLFMPRCCTCKLFGSFNRLFMPSYYTCKFLVPLAAFQCSLSLPSSFHNGAAFTHDVLGLVRGHGASAACPQIYTLGARRPSKATHHSRQSKAPMALQGLPGLPAQAPKARTPPSPSNQRGYSF